ncbi:hypothetical protein [Stenotrophomonas sp. HMWF003]|uniref:hypothetical protein n=1 Tax=Stenotrophomonas sp. HMWF003 TaxID=2056840 RepID=UPI0015E82D4B|nr:hypothetical protein [Stenotrophomonas sp. HMWF003]
MAIKLHKQTPQVPGRRPIRGHRADRTRRGRSAVPALDAIAVSELIGDREALRA